jgi:hypothetical protein
MLTSPTRLLDLANGLKTRISDFRNEQIQHPTDLRRLPTTIIYPITGSADVVLGGGKHPESKDAFPASDTLPSLLESVDEYLEEVVAFLRANASRSALQSAPDPPAPPAPLNAA